MVEKCFEFCPILQEEIILNANTWNANVDQHSAHNPLDKTGSNNIVESKTATDEVDQFMMILWIKSKAVNNGKYP